MDLKHRHYFNHVSLTRMPFAVGSALFVLLLHVAASLNMVMCYSTILLFFAIVFVFSKIRWFSEMFIESCYRGRYSKKLRVAFVCGFILFLCSELTVFGGFFWSYFDRIFSLCLDLCGSWSPSGILTVESGRWPVVGTVILVLSGYYANLSYYLLKVGEYFFHTLLGYLAILLAALFLLVQFVEYSEASFTVNDSVFSSFFYMLTGFHGFHVTVGFLFLVEQYERLVCVWSSTYIYDVRYSKRTVLLSVNSLAWYSQFLCRAYGSQEVLEKLSILYLRDKTIRPSFFCVMARPQITARFSLVNDPKRSLHYRFARSRRRQSWYYPNTLEACVCLSECGTVNQLSEKCTAMYDRQRHTGITAGIIYWHFVDIIWIFLFYCVYLFPNGYIV